MACYNRMLRRVDRHLTADGASKGSEYIVYSSAPLGARVLAEKLNSRGSQGRGSVLSVCSSMLSSLLLLTG
jgi:hypothetical protein